MYRLTTRLIVLSLSFGTITASADTYLYPATCESSYSKQGEQSDDLSKLKGKPIKCDNIVFALLGNGRVSVQIVESRSSLTPLGFSGSGLDYESNPNFVTVPLDAISLPHSSNPATAQTVNGIEGYCFVEGKFNLRSLSTFVCTSKMEIGTQKLVYNVTAKIKGVGQKVPGL